MQFKRTQTTRCKRVVIQVGITCLIKTERAQCFKFKSNNYWYFAIVFHNSVRQYYVRCGSTEVLKTLPKIDICSTANMFYEYQS